jgi:hypothetical protein
MKYKYLFILFFFISRSYSIYCQSLHNEAKNVIDSLKKDYDDGGSKQSLYLHPSSLRIVTASLFSNVVLGYDGYSGSIKNGSIKVNSKETNGAVTIGFISSNHKKLLRNMIYTINVMQYLSKYYVKI